MSVLLSSFNLLSFFISGSSDASNESTLATSSYLQAIKQYITLNNCDSRFQTEPIENAGFVSSLKIQGQLFPSIGNRGFLENIASLGDKCIPSPKPSLLTVHDPFKMFIVRIIMMV